MSIDVAACEIAQPRPSKPISSIVSPSSANLIETVTSSPQSGFWPSARASGSLEQPVVPRVLVVVEDVLAVEVFEDSLIRS